MAARKQKKTGWDSPATQDFIKSAEWYKQNINNPAFKGKMVAVRAGEVVAVGTGGEDLDRQLEALGDRSGLLVLRVFCPEGRSSWIRIRPLHQEGPPQT